MSHDPPYSIDDEIIDLIVRISRRAQSVTDYQTSNPNPRLRKQNRIRSVYSSCAIEANSLTADQISDMMDGRRVVGPEKDIKEVRNAIEAYSMLGTFDSYDLNYYLKMHGVMAHDTVAEAGMFRTCGEGVYSGSRLVFMAPPPELVPVHMEGLFEWLNESRGRVNPLVASCVFHYESVSIHPFTDGNGRMARLWQTAILGEWMDLFHWIPIENRIHKAQTEYYEVIDRCNAEGDSTEFIRFMLRTILTTLEDVEFEIRQASEAIPGALRRLTRVMETGRFYTSNELMDLLGLSSRASFQDRYLRPALARDLLEPEYPESPRRPGQRYRLRER